jgi:hypothetical protein
MSKTVPPPLWFLGLLALTGIALGAAPVALALGGPISAVGLYQAWARRRVVRARRLLAASGGGLWTGWLGNSCVEWLWPPARVGLWSSLMYPDRAPVRVTADLSGVTVALRGPIAAALWRRQPVLIPWTEIAGARSRDRGRGFDDRTVSLLRLTDVTVDVVGASAQGWADMWELDDAADDCVCEPARAEYVGAETDDDTAEEIREAFGPDWVPGTAALVLITTSPEGLVATISARGLGRPSPDLMPSRVGCTG